VPLRTAQATRFFEAWAQEGLPTPVVVPVETNLQLAHAEGDSNKQAKRKRE
jgi:hypothetical protein